MKALQLTANTKVRKVIQLSTALSGSPLVPRRHSGKLLKKRKPTIRLMKISDNTLQGKKMEDRTLYQKYDVFLGGSCGGRKSPTTWRKDVAIPLLTENEITFFNPQVETWTQDLIYKENKAKENSDWLLFMLETNTRGIVSLVEVAYLVGSGRSVLFILQKEREEGKICIKEDEVSKLERDDIVTAQQTLNTLIRQHDTCQYFSVLEKGLNHLIDGLKSNTTSLLQNNGSNSYSGKGERKPVNDFIHKLSSMFNRTHKHTDENGKKKRPQNLRITPYPRFSIGVIAPDNLCNMQQRLDTLRINKDSVYIAQGTGSTVIDQLMQCSIVLVVIPSTALACATMCKAAYLLSRHPRMMMCVQDLVSSTVDNGNTTLTSSAVDDFNRARAYLRDMANTHQIPVHTSVDDLFNSTSLVTQKTKSRHCSLISGLN
ncbi:hypothetical protein EB796_008658 [Bugula neritina]|uniref:Uncharacterized protein n=1 Tax=Bugula neritina TaxID=10212 RepID=A0A7J7K4D4_BUGNE|nr:hypothetical protein EB796_008658 [Bugula neritina]